VESKSNLDTFSRPRLTPDVCTDTTTPGSISLMKAGQSVVRKVGSRVAVCAAAVFLTSSAGATNLWYADMNGAIVELNSSFNQIQRFTQSHTGDIAFSPNGSLWENTAVGAIQRISTTDGSILQTIFANQAAGFTFDSAGMMWYWGYNNTIGEINPATG